MHYNGNLEAEKKGPDAAVTFILHEIVFNRRITSRRKGFLTHLIIEP